MLRKALALAVLAGTTFPSWATDKPATISGYVRSAAGVPQMGAVVEVLGLSLIHF